MLLLNDRYWHVFPMCSKLTNKGLILSSKLKILPLLLAYVSLQNHLGGNT